MNRVESRKNRVPSLEKKMIRGRRTRMWRAQRARDLVPHGPLTTTVRWRPFLILFIFSRSSSLYVASAPRLPSRASAASYTVPPRRWRWLIVAPLSRDNEISVCATRPPAGATLSFLYLRSFDIPLPLRWWTVDLPPRRRDLFAIRNIKESEKGVVVHRRSEGL